MKSVENKQFKSNVQNPVESRLYVHPNNSIGFANES